jgi:hypothetical protein
LRAAGVRGEVVSGSLQELAPTGLEVDGECISLIVSAGPPGLRARAMKRAFDTALTGAALVAFSPVMLIAGLAIKLGDGGPVFFVQRRLRRGNRFFQMLKFRSMRVDKADAHGNRSASLNILPANDQGQEIFGSRDDLASSLGAVPTGFAYPYGQYDAVARNLVEEAGFGWAVTTNGQIIHPRRHDRHALPRIRVQNWNGQEFVCAMRKCGA